MKRKILVTGATGLLGQVLLSQLGGETDIVACSRRQITVDSAKAKWEVFDLLQPRPLDLREVKTVFHLASNTKHYSYDADVNGTRYLLKNALQCGVEHFIYNVYCRH